MKKIVRKICVWLVAFSVVAGLFFVIPTETKAADPIYVEGFNKHITIDGKTLVVGDKAKNGDEVVAEMFMGNTSPMLEEHPDLKAIVKHGSLGELSKIWFIWEYYNGSGWSRYLADKNINSQDASQFSFTLKRKQIGRIFRFKIYNQNSGKSYVSSEFSVTEDTTLYDVNLFAGTGGKVSINGGTAGKTASDGALAEQFVQIKAIPDNGYQFVCWKWDSASGESYSSDASTTLQVERNSSNVLYAVFEPAPDVPVSGVTVKPTELELAATKSKTLKATVLPSDAKNKAVVWESEFPEIVKVNSKGKVTVVKYGQPVYIRAVSAEDLNVSDACLVQPRFADVTNHSKYFFDYVYWAADLNYVGGMKNGTVFGPEQNCTRKQMAIILWRYSKCPESSLKKMPFSDVKGSKKSATYQAILWAAETGLIKGYKDGTFRPDEPVTRKQTMIMLYRLAGKPKVEKTVAFKDVTGKSGSDSYNAIAWGSSKKITGGYSDGTFRPNESCLRKHIVTFLYRFAELFAKG